MKKQDDRAVARAGYDGVEFHSSVFKLLSFQADALAEESNRRAAGIHEKKLKNEQRKKRRYAFENSTTA
jgi:hypothetical protein